jgi:predicted transcriptional regulator
LKRTHYRRRNFDGITYSIVKGAFEGARKTRIMYASSLNLGQLNRYLAELMAQGLITYDPETKLYQTTVKGRQYLKTYERYAETIDQMSQAQTMLEEICERKRPARSTRLEAMVRNSISSDQRLFG